MQNNGQQGGKKNIIYLFAFESTVAFFYTRRENTGPAFCGNLFTV